MKTLLSLLFLLLSPSAQAQQQDSLYFSFKRNFQTVEIWTFDSIVFSGRVINGAYEEPFYKRKKQHALKWHYSISTLDTTTARKTFELYTETGMAQLADSKNIPGWSRIGCSGNTYDFTLSSGDTVVRKYYWSPKSQDLPEAAIVLKFDSLLNKVIPMEKYEAEFTNTLPNGCYRINNGMGILCILHRERDFSVNPFWTMDTWY